MYLQELNSIRKTQFDLENLMKQRARSNLSFLSEIKFLFEIITHDVLQLQSSMLKQFKGLEIQVSTFGALLSNKLEISQKLSDLSAFQAQFNIILEIQSDLEVQLRKKKWYRNTIDLVVRVIPSVSPKPNSVIQNPVLFSEKSVRKRKRKIEKEKPISLSQNITKCTSIEIEQTNEINQTLPNERIDEIILSSHSNCPVSMEEETHEYSLPQSVCLSQATILVNTQDNYVNKFISSDTILDNPQLFSQETNPSKTMDLSQTLPISSLSINQTQTQENFSSLLFDCTDLFPIKTNNGSLMDSQTTTVGNSPILGQKYNNTSFLTRDNLLQSQPLSQSQEILQHDHTWDHMENLTQYTTNETSKFLIDSMTNSRDTPSEYTCGNMNSRVSSSTDNGTESMKKSLSLNNNENGNIGVLPKKQCKQSKFNMHLLENSQQRESFGKPMTCKQNKKCTDLQKQVSSQNQNDFAFPTKQKSILHYVSPPGNNTNDWGITQRVGNDFSQHTHVQTKKFSGRTSNHKNTTNSKKINSRSFYKLSVLLINRNEITNDLPATMWTSDTIPEEVIRQLELDLNFW